MNTVGLMLLLTRALCSTGKAVIMDRGFFVFKVLLKTRNRGVYGGALIKNRLYWPRGGYGDAINDYFRSKILVIWGVLMVNGNRNSLIFWF